MKCHLRRQIGAKIIDFLCLLQFCSKYVVNSLNSTHPTRQVPHLVHKWRIPNQLLHYALWIATQIFQFARQFFYILRLARVSDTDELNWVREFFFLMFTAGSIFSLENSRRVFLLSFSLKNNFVYRCVHEHFYLLTYFHFLSFLSSPEDFFLYTWKNSSVRLRQCVKLKNLFQSIIYCISLFMFSCSYRICRYNNQREKKIRIFLLRFISWSIADTGRIFTFVSS